MIDILINKAANIFRACVIVMELSLNDAMIGTVHSSCVKSTPDRGLRNLKRSQSIIYDWYINTFKQFKINILKHSTIWLNIQLYVHVVISSVQKNVTIYFGSIL